MGRDQNRLTEFVLYEPSSNLGYGITRWQQRSTSRYVSTDGSSSNTPARYSSRESSDARVVPIGRRLCDPSAPLGGYRVERPEELESSVVGRDGLVLR